MTFDCSSKFNEEMESSDQSPLRFHLILQVNVTFLHGVVVVVGLAAVAVAAAAVLR